MLTVLFAPISLPTKKTERFETGVATLPAPRPELKLGAALTGVLAPAAGAEQAR